MATAVGENTAKRVGGVLVDIADYLGDVEERLNDTGIIIEILSDDEIDYALGIGDNLDKTGLSRLWSKIKGNFLTLVTSGVQKIGATANPTSGYISIQAYGTAQQIKLHGQTDNVVITSNAQYGGSIQVTDGTRTVTMNNGGILLGASTNLDVVYNGATYRLNIDMATRSGIFQKV